MATETNSNQEGPIGRAVATDTFPESWKPTSPALRFEVGGRCLGEATFHGMLLDAPLNPWSKQTIECPSWERFSNEIEVAVIPAQPVEQELPRFLLGSHFIRYAVVHENRYYVDLTTSFSDYLKKFSSKARKNLTREVRKFTEFSGGKIEWREFRSTQQMAEFHGLASEISRKTYQHDIGLGISESEEVKQSLVKEASRGLLRGYVLLHESRPIAFILCPVQVRNIVYQKVGYDPEFRDWSPGTVLLHVFLERLFEEAEFALLDFGQTEYDYKAHFSTGFVRCARVLYFRRNWRNLLFLGAHSGFLGARDIAAKALRTLRVKTGEEDFSPLLEALQ